MSRHIVLLCLALSFTSAPVSAVKFTLYSDNQCQTLETPPSWPGPNPVAGPLNSCMKSGMPSQPIGIKFSTCSTSTGATFANYVDYPNCNTVYGQVLTVAGSMIGVCQTATGGTSQKIECSSASALSSCVLALLVAMVAVLL